MYLYTQYCRYTTKMEGYTTLISDIPKLCEILPPPKKEYLKR